MSVSFVVYNDMGEVSSSSFSSLMLWQWDALVELTARRPNRRATFELIAMCAYQYSACPGLVEFLNDKNQICGFVQVLGAMGFNTFTLK